MASFDLEFEIQSALNGILQGTPQNLIESIRYSLVAPGKRIRPRLAAASGTLLDLSERAVVSAAVAVEMAHCFTLIHDDLPCMDDDDMRRGQPSNHKVHGEAVALLAGNALMAASVEVLLAAEVDAECLLRATRYWVEALGPRGVIGGQARELEMDQTSTLEDLRRMHRGKTGALFVAPVMIPAYLAGLSPSDSKFTTLENFADSLGLAFQVVDDLEDRDQDYTSVLYFQSAEEARSSAFQSLSEGVKQLELEFGDSSLELSRIADEVLEKLK